MSAHADRLAELRRRVLQSPGATSGPLRAAAYAEVPLGDPWGSYGDRVRDASCRIADVDVARLVAAGCSEDAVYEVTVAAALGAAERRLEAGLRVLDATRDP
jgi:hypothetical protein